MSRLSFGKFFRAAREKAKISLRRAARAAKISPTYLSDVELGRCIPSASVARAMALAIGLEPDEAAARLLMATGWIETPCAAQTLEEARAAVRRARG